MNVTETPSTPGSEIPGQPRYVVGTCGHPVMGVQWRTGSRTCDRCPVEPTDRYADIVVKILTAAKIPCHPPRVGAGISIELPAADATLNWAVGEGWSIHGRGSRNEQINVRCVGRSLAPTPMDIAAEVRSWLTDPNLLPADSRRYGRVELDELHHMLDHAAAGGNTTGDAR